MRAANDTGPFLDHVIITLNALKEKKLPFVDKHNLFNFIFNTEPSNLAHSYLIKFLNVLFSSRLTLLWSIVCHSSYIVCYGQVVHCWSGNYKALYQVDSIQMVLVKFPKYSVPEISQALSAILLSMAHY